MNWRGGFLRLWLVVNVVLMGGAAILLYSNYRCVAEQSADRKYWAERSREVLAKIEEYREGVEKGVPDLQLPVFLRSPEEEYKSTTDIIDRINETQRACEASIDRYWTLLWAAPAATTALLLASLWISAGFRPKAP